MKGFLSKAISPVNYRNAFKRAPRLIETFMHGLTCHQCYCVRHELMKTQIFVQLLPHCSATALRR